MIDIKNISPQHLPYISLFGRKNLPTISAIYFVMSSLDVIQYIGRTNNLRARWQQHHRLSELEKYQDCKIAWLEVSDSKLLPAIEEALIEYFKPSLNRTGAERRKSIERQKYNTVGTKFSLALDKTLDKFEISAKWLSAQTGVSQQMISGFRRGQQRIYSDSLERIIEGLPVEARGYLLCQLGSVDTQSLDLQELVMHASPEQKAEILNALATWVLANRSINKLDDLATAV